MRTTPRAAATAIAVGAVALRIPAYLATRHLSFDDGVYGASAVAMREGGLPFRDVFSSQGPLFLPLVWLADLLGLRTFDAPRLLALASAVGLVLATWSAARALRLSPASGRRWPPGWWRPAEASCGSPAPSRRTGRAWPWRPGRWPPPSGIAGRRPWPGRSWSASSSGRPCR